MFRKKLTVALLLLATAAVLEGLIAVWALGVAERHVQQGRVASDIQLGFVELSANKQRLRTWVSQIQFGPGAEQGQREKLQLDMRKTLQRLQVLSERAITLDDSEATRLEHVRRQDSLAVLERSLTELERTVATAAPLSPGTDARDAWHALSKLFDMSQGRDLRNLIGESIAREAAAMARERAAADAALRWMRILWLGAAGTIALAALLLAAYFTRALRSPLDRLAQGALALQRGELDHRIEADGRDEFSAVSRSVNAMAAELAQHRRREAQARHQLEELVNARTGELQAALEAMQEMDSRRRQLFADISHELRTPTTVIRGEAEITLRGNDRTADDYKTVLKRIVEASSQLGFVIDDLLTMTRSDTDTLALKRQPMDLTASLVEAAEQARTLAHERNIDLQAFQPTKPLPVLGDAQRLRQLLLVLLDNAVRYSHPGGKVRTQVRRCVNSEDIPHCEVLVVDEGIGISSQELPHVFERNFRGEKARLHRADGSGLGLSIATWLAKAHGGNILIESSPGLGTTVTLRLPLLSSPVELRDMVE
jgi:two-component system, OmpR family, sensor kinase